MTFFPPSPCDEIIKNGSAFPNNLQNEQSAFKEPLKEKKRVWIAPVHSSKISGGKDDFISERRARSGRDGNQLTLVDKQGPRVVIGNAPSLFRVNNWYARSLESAEYERSKEHKVKISSKK